MLMKKNIKNSGFTIVELLIVIVVIGILAALVISTYSGVQARANNAARYTEINSWRQLLDSYKALNGNYPSMPDGGYCLGTGFPNGKCRDYTANNANTYTEANSTALMTQLKTVGSLPGSSHSPVNGTVGPYITYGSGFFELTGVFNGKSTDCPSGLSYMWDDGAGRLLCYVDVSL